MTELETLLALGCTLNAGYLDYYDGRQHYRFASASVNGTVTFEPGGRVQLEAALAHFADAAMSAPPSNPPTPEERGIVGIVMAHDTTGAPTTRVDAPE